MIGVPRVVVYVPPPLPAAESLWRAISVIAPRPDENASSASRAGDRGLERDLSAFVHRSGGEGAEQAAPRRTIAFASDLRCGPTGAAEDGRVIRRAKVRASETGFEANLPGVVEQQEGEAQR